MGKTGAEINKLFFLKWPAAFFAAGLTLSRKIHLESAMLFVTGPDRGNDKTARIPCPGAL